MIDFSKGFAAIALAEHRGAAWHGHGAYVGDSADLAEWQRRAGADFTVLERKLFYAGRGIEGQKGPPTLVPDRKALLRSDTFGYLSTVGDGYNVVQPKELFDFQRQVIEAAGAKMDTAGVLSDGKRVWTLSRFAESFRIKGQDQIDTYILASTSYDSTMASRFQLTTTRVVCNNTLQIAMGGTRHGYISVPHSTTVNVKEVADQILAGADEMNTFRFTAEMLAEVIPTNEQIAEFLSRVLDNPFRMKDGKLEMSDPAKKVATLISNGQGADLRSAKGTAWGLVNAVTEYVDHYQRSKDQGTRLNSAWFGQGAERKAKAFALANEMFLKKEAA
jgi:phage/plasmid-like protein (TIGR03299 family)